MKGGTENSSSAFADLTEEEREKILEVIQRDFSLREQERKRLAKIEEDVRHEEREKSLLTHRKDFNENFCWCCCRAFGYIFNRRQICIKCRAYVCKSCSCYDTASKGYICYSCIKKDDLKSMSLEWFYTSVSKRFKRFGSAKIVRAFYKKKSASQRNLSDSELESGFMPTSSLNPAGKSRLPLQEVFDCAILDGSNTISESDYVESDYVESDYVEFDHADSDHVDSDHVDSDHADSDHADSDHADSDHADSDHVDSDHADSDHVDSDHAGSDYAESDYAESDHAESDYAESDRAESDYAESDYAESDYAESDYAESDYVEFDYIESDYVESDYVESDYIESDHADSDHVDSDHADSDHADSDHVDSDHADFDHADSDHAESDYAESDYAEPNHAESDHAESNHAESDCAESDCAESGYAESDYAESDYAESDYVESDYVESDYVEFDYIEVDLTSQLLTSRHKSSVNRRQLPRSTSLDVLPKSNMTKTQSLEVLGRDSFQRHSVWDLPIRDPNKVLEVNVSKLQKKDVQNGSSTILQTKDIYREAFENTRKAEEQKFSVKFDSLLDDLRQALDNQTPSGISNIHNSTSYGEIMVSYRKRIRELLSVLSQRLQLAVENYLEEENAANMSQKVKQIVSRLVEDQLGESVDLTSDEAVSDLSSLSDESTEVHQCYEDQLAQAVVSKVIENQRREGMPNPQERVQEILEATNASTEASQVPHSPDDTAAKIIAELKSYSKSLPGRKLPMPLQVEEVIIPYEAPIEKKLVSRVNSPNQSPSLNLTSRDLADRSHCTLPNLDELDFESEEIDPDLLSLNLTPIKEVDEEIEDMVDFGAGHSLSWHQNWILRDLNSKKRVEEISQNHPVLVPQPEEVLSPRIGNKDADELSDLSENDELESDVSSSLSGEGEFCHSNEDLAEKGPKSLTELFSPVEAISANILTPPIGTSSPVKTSDAEDSYSSLPDKQSTTSQMPVTSINPEPVIKSIPSEEGDPKFEVPPESQKIAEGEAVKWQCRVSGTKPIDIFWFRIESEVHELEENEKYEMTKEEDTNKHTLTIHHPSKAEAGQYMCIAVNEKGECSEYFILNIEDNTQPIKAPEFLKSPQDVEVIEGQMVKFRCKVKGYPPPRITWYKDGKLLKGNSSCKLEKFGNRDYLLTIEYATMDDDAEYSVLAKNIGGESRVMVQLLVEPLESLESDSLSSLRVKLSFSSNTLSPTSESSPERSSPVMPQAKMEENASAKKEDLHIQNLSRKMTRTKDGVSDVAEELLQSADEMTLIQQHLDFMDHTLNKLEININQDLTKDTSNEQDSLNNNEDSQIDDLFAHQVLAEYHVQDPVACCKNDSEKVTEEEAVKKDEVEDPVTIDDELVVDDMFAHRVLAEHREQKTAAENMRKVTTSALAILQSAEDALALGKKDSQNNVILAEQDIGEVFDQHKTNELSSCTDSKMVSSEETSLNIGLTPETEKKDPFSANENILIDLRCASPVKDNSSNLPVEKLNFGPKPINLQRFSRDFYVNSPSVTSKNTLSTQAVDWRPSSKIKEEVAEAEDKIYIAANGVYSLEDKIQQLESQVESIHEGMSEKSMSDIEDEVAKTVAQVEHSEHQVASLESSVDQLQRATECLPSLSPRQSVDSGVSSTKEQFHVPKILIGQSSEEEVPESRSEFDADSGIELPSVTQLKAMFNQPKDTQGDASIKRIHSITARSLSKIQMEGIQKQQIEGEASKESPIGLDGRPAERHRPSLKTIPAPTPPGGLSQNTSTRRRAPLAPPLRDADAESEDVNKTSRIKKGGIAARTAFWEKVMQQGGMSEQDEKSDFPELLEKNVA